MMKNNQWHFQQHYQSAKMDRNMYFRGHFDGRNITIGQCEAEAWKCHWQTPTVVLKSKKNKRQWFTFLKTLSDRKKTAMH